MNHYYNEMKIITRILITSFIAWSTFAEKLIADPFSNVNLRAGLISALQQHPLILDFYLENDYELIWFGNNALASQRRAELVNSLQSASFHGLPGKKYQVNSLLSKLSTSDSLFEIGLLEGLFMIAFTEYASDLDTGVLIPSEVDTDIVRQINFKDTDFYIQGLLSRNPYDYFRSLGPQSSEYARLLVEYQKLSEIIRNGGWSNIATDRILRFGDSGDDVVAIRNRLFDQGYMPNSISTKFDKKLLKAVQKYQSDHGLVPDGIIGAGTILELNITAEQRLSSIIVALERERWLGDTLGQRHIWVNLADFKAKIIEDHAVVFETRTVLGVNDESMRSPEFSDKMEYMVVNPTWHIPVSIAKNEYLPELKKDPEALPFLKLFDSSGSLVDRESIDFSILGKNYFPYEMKQLPSTTNALGLVKFMFPNPYNIYLHDTPAKDLFMKEVRDFSHGCIRLHEPFDFAYALLEKQTDEPQSEFQNALKSQEETIILLSKSVPVHITYRTAFTKAGGGIEFRRDIYGRDQKIYDALVELGLELSENI
ncbi:L,D-transpeptidase family protein [Paracoccaceae bacterium]|nr:L,D-transpeptidase family protein [Paracoccaceae bacterium]